MLGTYVILACLNVPRRGGNNRYIVYIIRDNNNVG